MKNIKSGLKDKVVVDCRQCQNPILESLEGIVTKKKTEVFDLPRRTVGWCYKCIKKAMPLMSDISKIATGDMDFEDFLEMMGNKRLLAGFERSTGSICPSCGDRLSHGSFFDACRKCSPVYFEQCRVCGQTKVNCLCELADTVI